MAPCRVTFMNILSDAAHAKAALPFAFRSRLGWGPSGAEIVTCRESGWGVSLVNPGARLPVIRGSLGREAVRTSIYSHVNYSKLPPFRAGAAGIGGGWNVC